jgi:tight adherence protein B
VRRAGLAVAALAALALPAPALAGGSTDIRRVDVTEFPLVRLTAVVPPMSSPTLREAGRPVVLVGARELASGEGVVLAVDNSDSMAGAPLREAKRAASQFLRQHRGRTGLVAFGHSAVALTPLGSGEPDVARALAALAPDTTTGTSLYDAVRLSVARLRQMSDGSRVLVLLTDGRDRGSQTSLRDAIAAAERANVVVYAIAAGPTADRGPLAALAAATGGRVIDAADTTSLGAAYRTLGAELDRTWQLSYVSTARPGDRVTLTLRAGRVLSNTTVSVPESDERSVVPASVAQSAVTAVSVVLLTVLLLVAAVLLLRRAGRGNRVVRLLEPHLERAPQDESSNESKARFAGLLDWTEQALDDLPGSKRLASTIERSGSKLRAGLVPYLACLAAFVLGIAGAIAGAPPALSLLLMLVGLALPFAGLSIAARRRTKAFDEQLPDVLATIASTLRAGHGLRPALRAIADDGTPPTSEEFARVLGEERLGRPLDQAIAGMCERIDSADLEYVATAVNVQSQTGGSLAGLFDTLSETVRERQRHARKVRALTALGRISAIVLVALPVGLGALMTLISAEYMSPLFTTSAGHVVIGICVTSMAIGSLFLKRIVSVRY